MKIIALVPEKNSGFVNRIKEKLSIKADVILKTQIEPIPNIPELHDEEEKILALDPDFLNWSFTKENIDSIPNIKAICLQTTSFSWVDSQYAKEKGIPVTNLRGFSTEAVAEYALFMMLGVSRKFPLILKDGFKQSLDRHSSIELKGKKVGVVGLGNIGKRFAELCAGLGMEVVYWSRNSRDERFKFLELKEVISTSDVIFPALAKNDESVKLITDELLATLKPTAIFVSISHKIYNHDLLLRLAREGKIYGYAFEEDNGNSSNYEGNVFSLPSLAWATDRSMKLNEEMWIESIANASNDLFPNRINK